MSTLLTLLFQWLSLLSLISSSTIVSAKQYNIPRLSVFGGNFEEERRIGTQAAEEVKLSKDFEHFFYNQTLDHFNYKPESYATFQQKYVINSKYWGGAKENAPILVYFGSESPLTDNQIYNIGFLEDNAPHLKALLIYIEHRYYGQSVPFISFGEALKNSTLRGYFNSAQAIADYAEIILHVKEKFSAHYSPVIAIGGSYGGKLTTWFRLHYPHIALGALASSAPVLYFDDITPQDGYFKIITKDFKEASETCYQTIKQSWSEIDKIGSQQNGLSILSQKFKTCLPLNSSEDLKDYLEATVYTVAAQYNHPPKYPVSRICAAIDGAPQGTDIFSRIFAGVVAYRGVRPCYNMTKNPNDTPDGYRWQMCSEMVMPIGHGNESMFETDFFDLNNFTKDCVSSFGVPPRPHWVTTYYGGHDIRLVLQRFGSNIIFSNGMKDPYSIGGVLDGISDTILSINTANGSHCLDIHRAKETDPDWLIKQRQTEIDIIKGWIKNYFIDLSSTQKIK
ncbi:uncharacterized protein LOC132310120 [Cornus florida]|uniref:uncharacterized protein LOC132310120 n=1 Tax=Cornus florida TaxID=4283 RepID=UPI0028A23BCF|nr:uncharacterized protein LOC132310120 [Cornus florida]